MTFLEKLRCLFTFGQGVALPLPEISEKKSPIELFDLWFDEANKSGILLAEAMSVSTVSSDGKPSSRMVLLKSFDEQGFVFYSNYGSRKSQELINNNQVALLFHWGVLQRQVRIEGIVEKVSKEESEQYFQSRDRGSQIGAWASKQSETMCNESELKERFKLMEQEFAGKTVPLPEFWGGWRIIPERIEFWQGRASRLHDRVIFTKQDNRWEVTKLFP